MTDLGISRYPTYTIERTMHAFPDRAALLAYEQGLRDAGALDAALEVREAACLSGCTRHANACMRALHAAWKWSLLARSLLLLDVQMTPVSEQAEDEDAAQQALAVARATVQAQQHKQAWFSPHLQARRRRPALCHLRIPAVLRTGGTNTEARMPRLLWS